MSFLTALGSFGSSVLGSFANNIGAVGSGLLSGLAGNASSRKAARRAYEYSLDLQNRQNEFTERMSNTAHQREVRDLLQAGLNPILSATGGQGASTPAAGSSSQSPVDPRYQDAIATALDFKRLQNENKLRASQVDLNESQWFLNRGQEASAREQGNYIRTQNALLEKYGPDKYLAEINDIMNQIENRNATTAQQLKLMKAQEWRLRHQALGFSFSESKNDSYQPFEDVKLGVNAGKFGKIGFGKSGTKYVQNYSRSRTY